MLERGMLESELLVSGLSRRAWYRVGAVALATVVALLMLVGGAGSSAHAQAPEAKRVMIYTGTMGFRHTAAINTGRPIVQTALESAGYIVDWEDCTNAVCRTADKNPRIFTPENLARYASILMFQAGDSFTQPALAGQLWDPAEEAAIIGFVQNGGGISAVHNATDMGVGLPTWDWWDGSPNSAMGTTMPGHAASSLNNVATVQVADHNHLSTRDLPDTYTRGDEHYNYLRNVRGTHHVLATLDERTYTPGVNAKGQDHPISWCKLYDGVNIDDGTSTRRNYRDGRIWATGMGHFAENYTAAAGGENLVKHIVGGVRWVSGEGRKTDCSGTVWSAFRRTVLVDNVNGPMAIDVAPDGKVYWTEIGTQGFVAQGYVKMHDPKGPANNSTIVATIPTHDQPSGHSENGVLGMGLEPGFDLSNPSKRDIFVYYSPRPGPGDNWPTTGNAQVLGYNLLSRFTLNSTGDKFLPTDVNPDTPDPAHPFLERQILRVPNLKVAGRPSGFPGGPAQNGNQGHVAGTSVVFDSDGSVYLGTGDDISPNASGHSGYPPMDHRASEGWDARKTAANSADLRGKIIRVKPLDDIQPGTLPGIGSSYTIPAGNMFAPGTPKTRPEIYAMGFRQPFTLHTDAAKPGHVVVGEYCHDASTDNTLRGSAGVCEWNLVSKPGFHGWPFCMGDNSLFNTQTRWNYGTNSSTGQKYDCSLSEIPSDIRYAPAGGVGTEPSNDGLDTLPGPAERATIWKKYANASNQGVQNPLDFGDLSAGNMSPITGPVYRYRGETARPGAFPNYYDGSWLIGNRDTATGFWKEVRLRTDNGQAMRVNDWIPQAQFGAPNSSYVIPTKFGADGALYMGRWDFGCCRNNLTPTRLTQLVKIEFNVFEDEVAPSTTAVLDPATPGPGRTYTGPVTVKMTGTDTAQDGTQTSTVDYIEYRASLNGVPGPWTKITNLSGANPFEGSATLSELGAYVGRVPGGGPRRQRGRGQVVDVLDQPADGGAGQGQLGCAQHARAGGGRPEAAGVHPGREPDVHRDDDGDGHLVVAERDAVGLRRRSGQRHQRPTDACRRLDHPARHGRAELDRCVPGHQQRDIAAHDRDLGGPGRQRAGDDHDAPGDPEQRRSRLGRVRQDVDVPPVHHDPVVRGSTRRPTAVSPLRVRPRSSPAVTRCLSRRVERRLRAAPGERAAGT